MSIEITSHGIGIRIIQTGEKEIAEIRLHGKLTHEDYQVMVPVIERAIEAAAGRELDLLVDMREFAGWTREAALDDMRFGLKIRNAFDKMAIVGNKKWEEISTKLMDHLSRGEMRFFTDYDEALAWIAGV